MNVSYTLALQPAQHLIDVTITVDQIDAAVIDLQLPTWTPGSYLIREYARHVQEFAATASDRSLPWRKLDKLTWRVETNGSDRITVRYRVYGNELTVRTNHVDDTHAHVIPAATFMAVIGATDQLLPITIDLPKGWDVATGLDPAPNTQHPIPNTYLASNYDHLIDSPFEIGTHRTLQFEVDGKPHRIVIWGRGNENEERLINDTRRIVQAARDLFGGLPYDHYTFFLLLGGKNAGGGLEHRNSTSLLAPRWTFGSDRSYERYLTVTCHEFFHVWNVKRIRAAGLGPFDYTRETYTTLLWAMEGITEYYTDLLLARSGLLTPARYLERLADDIVTLQGQAGRTLQSLECSSFDTWIKLYRPDENSANTSISYYLKGAIVGALLDLEIHRRTANERSLDDVMRYLFAAYPIDGPGIPERNGYLQAIREATGQDLSDFFARYIGGVDELPYDDLFGAAGLKLTWDWKDKAPDGSPRASLGLKTKQDGALLKVASVMRDGPAYNAGVSADDELIAIDSARITDDGTLRERLNDCKPDDQITLLIARREELRSYDVTLQAAPQDKLTIERIEQPSDEQRRIYESWIGQH